MRRSFTTVKILSCTSACFSYWLEIGILCSSPLLTIFQLYRGDSFIGGGNQNTRRKPPNSIYYASHMRIAGQKGHPS